MELLRQPPPCADPEVAEPVAGNYFVAAYPPFSCWSAAMAPAARCQLDAPRPADAPFLLYVHVPFCAHRCDYCYYLSTARHTRPQMVEYLAALLRELTLYRESPAFAGRRPGGVYVGGGTPSLLPADDIARLLDGLRGRFPWSAAEEVTFECAPRSTTVAKLAALRRAGVNRLSLGVQQLDDDVLRANGRVHLVADVERAWGEVRAAGFDEVNIDLIAGLVGETDDSFRRSLDRVVGMGPDAVTVYQLEVPLNTPLYRSLAAGTGAGALPTWAEKRARAAYAFDRLAEAGYARRSAYAAARGRHRRFAYQEDQYRGADLVGLGASAISYVGGLHYQNVASLDGYLGAVAGGGLPVGRAYRLTRDEQVVREFVLQLKLGRVEAGRFRERFGVEIADRFADTLHDLAGRGWLTFDRGAVALSRDGLLRADGLLTAFYLPEHRGVRYS
jgi:oxygen-independent coproporphyrinogen-3 oxidase